MPILQHDIKAVLFDLDDTLWPIVPVIRRAETLLHDWLARHAPALAQRYSKEQLRAVRNDLLARDPAYALDLWKLRHAVLTHALRDSDEDPALADHAMVVFQRARNEVTPFEDVQPGLADLLGLAPGLKIGSISNGFADLEEIGLAHHFHYSIAAHQSGCAKPDAAIFLRACAALEVLPAEAVYVGDDPALDVEGAQKAGMLGVWMNRPGLDVVKQMPDHIQPDAVVTNLTELAAWLAPHVAGRTAGPTK
jgi:putative hydrolase of the HAD superfamily